jgi:hypothetical protein
VELDPRSTDFGKIKVGKTRIDIWGGFQQYIRAATQMYKKERKTEDGEIQKVDPKDVFTNLIQGKLAPLPGVAVRAIEGKGADGQPFNAGKEALGLITPMGPAATVEAVREHGLAKGLALSAPDYLGFGVNTQQERNPFPPDTDPKVVSELKRLKIKIDPPDATIHVNSERDKVRLTDEQLKAFREKEQKAILARLKTFVNGPGYQGMTDRGRPDRIREQMSMIRTKLLNAEKARIRRERAGTR